MLYSCKLWKLLRKMATDTIWNWQSYPRRSVCRAKCTHWRTAYLRGTSWDPYASSMKQIALKLGDLLTLGVGPRFVHQAMWRLCSVQDSVLGTLKTCNAHSQWCTASEQYWPMGKKTMWTCLEVPLWSICWHEWSCSFQLDCPHCGHFWSD